MKINPQPPSAPPARKQRVRRSAGPALNALTIVGFVVAIALAGHQFSNSTAPPVPSASPYARPTLPLATLHALRSGAAHAVVHRAPPRQQAHAAQIAMQPVPASRPSAVPAMTSFKPADAPPLETRTQSAGVVCTAAMTGTQRETCLTQRLRWADRHWRAEFRAATAGKSAQPRQRG